MFSQSGVGADAHRHDHQLGLDFRLGGAARLEAHGGHAPIGTGQQRLGLGAEQKPQAARLQRALQQFGGALVELALHQPRGRMHHGHLHAALHQPVGGF